MPLMKFHPLLHIVPHTPLYNISTLPSTYELPPASLTAVFPKSQNSYTIGNKFLNISTELIQIYLYMLERCK